mmetsp:Transcript_25928/g.82107  ORF Transcript_25928/g.82107 Transcript_25928/m.82107 type:complete len:283 (+) Transcript_25928:1268-2116(+)
MEGMTDGENVILGVASASLVAVTLQPTLYWKNAAAHGLPFTLRPSLLFRGCGVNLLKESSEMALQFAVAGRMKSGGGGCSLSSAAREMSGAIGGGTFGALLVTPFECVMIQQQLHGTSLLATPSRIARRFGVLSGGLYRGLAIAASRDAIYVGGMLGLTPVVRRYLVEDRGLPSTRAGMLAAAVGGVAGGVLSHPWDVVKTCMQGDLERIRYGTASQTLRNLIREGGPMALFRGVGWRTLNITLTVFIAGEVCAHLPRYLLPMTRRAGGEEPPTVPSCSTSI